MDDPVLIALVAGLAFVVLTLVLVGTTVLTCLACEWLLRRRETRAREEARRG